MDYEHYVESGLRWLITCNARWLLQMARILG